MPTFIQEPTFIRYSRVFNNTPKGNPSVHLRGKKRVTASMYDFITDHV